MPKFAHGTRLTSAAQEDYLKAIHALSSEGEAVANSVLAEELAVSAASVSEMLGKLAILELVTHDPYRGARLTDAGRAIAVEIVRHHRLLETYLVQALGYSWDEVHQEADRLEHAISERFEERMWEALGRPAFDPHGDPIPGADGRLEAPLAQSLHLATAGTNVIVSRISDRDPEKLRAIERLGIAPGQQIRIVRESQWEGPVFVQVAGADVPVALGLARAIFTRPAHG